MPAFYLPGTTAMLLRARTFMSDVAIRNCLRNYGASGEAFLVMSVRPGNHHYYVRPANGGFYFYPTQLPTGYMR